MPPSDPGGERASVVVLPEHWFRYSQIVGVVVVVLAVVLDWPTWGAGAWFLFMVVCAALNRHQRHAERRGPGHEDVNTV